MTDYEKLIEILSNQSPKGVKSGNWDQVIFEQGRTTIIIDSAKVGFEFTLNGRFVGLFNWKE